MTTLRTTWLATALVAVAAALALPTQQAAAAEVTVMTFNIRYDFENDARNRWEQRKESVAGAITAGGAQIVCLQEDKEHQITDLKGLLPETFAFLGKGRNETGSGERCTVLYDQRAFAAVQNGDFWLSDTPQIPGSNTWGDKYPRKVTWALLATRKKSLVLVLNTHLVEGKKDKWVELRRKAGEKIQEWVSEFVRTKLTKRDRRKLVVVLTGDFNSPADPEESPVYPHFVLDDEAASDTGEIVPFVDAWTAAAVIGAEGKEADGSGRWDPPGTFHGFKGQKTTTRIDWILVAGRAVVARAWKFEDKVNDRYPSDHYPVLARIVIP